MIDDDVCPPQSEAGRLGSDGDDAQIDAIIDALRHHTGVDVREYRRSTVERRIRNRMLSIASPSVDLYAQRIARAPDEAHSLLQRISIKVSEFYRNPDVFTLLQTRILPALSEAARFRPLRIWSAGCGRGEEAWTLAMLLHAQRIDGIIEATDIDATALTFARRAQYSIDATRALPPALAGRYLTHRLGESSVLVNAELQGLVRFATHDLLSAHPAPGEGAFDLICCRNVMIYFQRAAQERTFLRLQRALAPAGFLCVGEAEWPCGPAASGLFSSSPRSRVFHQRASECAA